ncbi:glutamyl-tRNA synthetase [Sporomusaceae bacterium BoRhaA]|uniref:glutamate--tRNA ligase n=1 Tax=Pelorhabdus rhamnosifermentans TaxID=2772457 RepID=UPI001C06128B|nr:glutamate--tRNA ligase [Pelorhabdus rhamnosifermentans]MBU2702534.1 glutamyl-tRNA synthetase [Pelorhabdus rhamnosifermentans]
MDHVRVRFAPSPTGYLHIGGARTALFNWFFARQHHGKFILRIEDTDTKRLKEDSVSQILASMKWLGIDWDEGPEIGGSCGPYYQSERLDLYKKEAQRLVKEGKAYYCFCTPEDLAKNREIQREQGQSFRYNGKCRDIPPEVAKDRIAAGEKAVIRLRIPDSGQMKVTDCIHGEVTFALDQLDDLIIMKSNAMPAYNFACVVDDHHMAISHIIRAEEHLSNTPKQVLLYEALGYEVVQFAHLPMILAPDRSKLSKRHGATSVEEFREQGFLAPAIVNYLTFLGWSPGDDQEIITPTETIKKFMLNKVSKTAAIYDTKKLTWINSHYLTNMDLDDLTREAIPFLISQKVITKDQAHEQAKTIQKVITVVRDRVKTLAELPAAMDYYFKEVTTYDEKGVKKHFSKPGSADLLRQGREQLAQLETFDVEHTEETYRNLTANLGIKVGELIHPTRLALTGRLVSPGLFDVMALLGKELCLKRMDEAINYISTLEIANK